MSDENEDIEVVVDAAEKTKDDEIKVEIEPEIEAKQPEITPKEGIEELKRRLQAEQLARAEAERRMRAAYQHAQETKRTATQEVTEAHYHQVVSALETVKSRAKALKAAFAEASSVGDYAKAAEINEAMIEAQDQLDRLKQGKKAIKQHLEAAQTAAPIEQMPPPPPRIEDVVEDMASKVSPRSAGWLRNNKEHIRDERAIQKMMNAHQAAVLDDIEPDTDEYFAFIEKRMGIRRDAPSETRSEASSPLSSAADAAPRRAPQPPPAPVSRGAPRPGTVRLSVDEARTAKDLGMSPEEYAKNKQLLIKEGRYSH